MTGLIDSFATRPGVCACVVKTYRCAIVALHHCHLPSAICHHATVIARHSKSSILPHHCISTYAVRIVPPCYAVATSDGAISSRMLLQSTVKASISSRVPRRSRWAHMATRIFSRTKLNSMSVAPFSTHVLSST